MLKGVVFDFDDTLTDFMLATSKTEAFISLEMQKNHKVNAFQFLHRFNYWRLKLSGSIDKPSKPRHNSRALWFSKVFKELNIEEDPEVWEFKYWRLVNKHIKCFPNALHVLKVFKNSDLKTGLVTDSDGKKIFKQKRIAKLGLKTFFDVVIMSDDVGVNKPSVKVFKALCESLNLNPEELVIIGNDPVRDLKNSKNLGFTTVWTVQSWFDARTYDFVDFKIEKIQDLLRLKLFKKVLKI